MTTAPQVSAQPTRYERQPPLATDSKITVTPCYRRTARADARRFYPGRRSIRIDCRSRRRRRSVLELVAALEYPAHQQQAQHQECQRRGGARDHVHVRDSEETPAKAADQIHHRVEERDLLP